MSICYSIAVIFFLPAYFAVKFIKASNRADETKGYWTLTEFGETTVFKCYSLILLVFETIIPLLILIILNVATLYTFNKLMTNKQRRTSQSSDNRNALKANGRFTVLIIALTFICIVTRVFDSSSAIYYRVNLFFDVQLSDLQLALIICLKHIFLFLLFTAHSLDGLMYYIYDKKMSSIFRFSKRSSLIR